MHGAPRARPGLPPPALPCHVREHRGLGSRPSKWHRAGAACRLTLKTAAAPCRHKDSQGPCDAYTRSGGGAEQTRRLLPIYPVTAAAAAASSSSHGGHEPQGHRGGPHRQGLCRHCAVQDPAPDAHRGAQRCVQWAAPGAWGAWHAYDAVQRRLRAGHRTQAAGLRGMRLSHPTPHHTHTRTPGQPTFTHAPLQAGPSSASGSSTCARSSTRSRRGTTSCPASWRTSPRCAAQHSTAGRSAAQRKVAQCSAACVRDGWCSAGAAVARWQPCSMWLG